MPTVAELTESYENFMLGPVPGPGVCEVCFTFTDRYARCHTCARARPFDGEAVLLVDDTWTTGANLQSAAAALKVAGAGPVAAIVIGRHLNREWGNNDQRIRALERPFEWQKCALCARPHAPVNE